MEENERKYQIPNMAKCIYIFLVYNVSGKYSYWGIIKKNFTCGTRAGFEAGGLLPKPTPILAHFSLLYSKRISFDGQYTNLLFNMQM